ncbi:MAG: hypothetical protein J1E40_01405 [Oscillospiraceae bacterium]|nr:hypothetical protein [Oscillospiraceae bacterium]
MFCGKCGRELRDGEICSCMDTSAVGTHPEHAADTKASSALPESQALVEGAKNAAAAIKNNPMVSEVIDTIKGVIVSPIKQVSENAYRTDILWMILTALEGIMISFGITNIIRKGIYALVTSSGIVVEYKDYSDKLKELGLSSGKIFGAEFICAVISFIASMLLILVLMTVCRKNVVFTTVANMTATAFLPSSILMAAAGLLSFVNIFLCIIAAVAALISATVLLYVGIQKLDKFDSPPFWLFVICILLLNIINALAEKVCLGKLVDDFISSVLISTHLPTILLNRS